MQSDTTQNIQEWIDGTGYLINPTPTVLREIATSLTETDNVLKVLVKREILNGIDREYTVASQLAQLVEDGVIELREFNGGTQTNLIVTDSVVGAFIDLDDFAVGVGAMSDESVEKATPVVESLWADSSRATLRTPPVSEVKRAFEDWLDESVYEEFSTAVTAVEQLAQEDRGSNTVLFTDRQHTYAALLVAGAVTKSGLRELARCAEYSGLASRSTLSRLKNKLEDDGYLATQQLESSIGRPPMQLQKTGLYSGDDSEMLIERIYSDWLDA